MTFVKKTDSEDEQRGQGPIKPDDSALGKALAEIAKLTEKVNEIQQNAIKASTTMSDADVARIAAIVAQTQKVLNPRDIDYSLGIQEGEIPLEDYDEKGVRFCCPLVGYLINDDKRKGHLVKIPYNKKEIFFEYSATRKVMVGKHSNLSPMSVYWSYSKKEQQWLREHTLYSIMFYESSNEAMNTDASQAMRLANIMKALKPLELHDLFRRCKEYGVAQSEDGDAMRANIAVKMLEKEFANQAERSLKSLNDTFKSAKLIGRE